MPGSQVDAMFFSILCVSMVIPEFTVGTAGKSQRYPFPEFSYWVIKIFSHFLQMAGFFSSFIMLIQNSLQAAAGSDRT